MSALGKAFRKQYKPFFKSLSIYLKGFEIIENAIPQEISDIYQQIKATGKWRYRRWVRKYDELYGSIEQHNQNIRDLQGKLDSFSIAAFYNAPEEWTLEALKPFVDAAKEAKNFAMPLHSPYLATCEGILEIEKYFSAIKRQHEIYIKLADIIARIARSDGHIRFDLRDELVQEDNEARAALSAFRKYFYPFEDLPFANEEINRHNAEIAERKAGDQLFDDIGGVSLDSQQRNAAVCDEKNALVIAGAGSGKTTTICGRVRYLLEREGVDPSKILLLSYSRKSADDLASKMAKISPDLSVGTFHKIGLEIITSSKGKKYAVEEQFDAIIEDYFRVEMMKDADALRDILIYYGLFLNNGEGDRKYKNDGEMFAEIRKDDFVTFKESLLSLTEDIDSLQTIKKEKVKSFEEMAIANFYFINGIEYEYERSYEFDESTLDKRQYTPDFYLKDYKIYHEHYGIDRNGRAKQYEGEAEREYLRGMLWKKQCHATHHTTCIETYSYQFTENTIFGELEKKLKEMGVAFHPLSDEEIRKTIQSIYEGRSFRSFINLVCTFLSLYKSRYKDASAFETLKSSSFSSEYGRIRASLFLTICQRIYAYYIAHLREQGKIDFDDMILQASEALPESNYFKFDHVIVDEFQDISYSRAMFLKTIVDHNNANLFCVGDDWQSIYRFSGSDLSFFLGFDTYFGKSEHYEICNVHRNSQQLQDAMARFIEKNPEQIKKKIHSDKTIVNPIRVIYYGDGPYLALKRALAVIAKSRPDASVLLLGRNNRDIVPYVSHTFFYEKRTASIVCKDFPDLKLSYSTVHGSKGLEADVVILLSAEDAPNGFPNKTEDDPLLNLVMSAPSAYLFAEERRLWYVALTRTKSYVFVLAPKAAPSIFLKDMDGDYLELNPEELEPIEDRIPCPRCKGGHLVQRESEDGHSFYGCSNYPYCKYTIDDFVAVERGIHCPICHDFMIFRKGQWGAFYGCHNYPRCLGKREYRPGEFPRRKIK